VTTATEQRNPPWIGWVPLLTLPLLVIAVGDRLPPWAFMWMLAFSIYAGLKWLTWWKARNHVAHTAWRSVAYVLAWPGMDGESFLNESQRAPRPLARDWLWAAFETAAGAVVLWAVARAAPEDQPLLRGWIGMLGLILLLHFGSFQLVSLAWQRAGICAPPIMAAPLRSTSLAEFWGKRWNLGFRQLAHDLIFRPLHRALGVGVAGFLVFVAAGLIHDLVISVPARGGYGLPTTYFVIQGLGVAAERSRFGRRIGLGHGTRGWLFMAAVTAVPAFWLFHPPFVRRVVLPFMHAIHAL
jgi:alginate O-acetyltransferase complex protein AlgI